MNKKKFRMKQGSKKILIWEFESFSIKNNDYTPCRKKKLKTKFFFLLCFRKIMAVETENMKEVDNSENIFKELPPFDYLINLFFLTQKVSYYLLSKT